MIDDLLRTSTIFDFETNCRCFTIAHSRPVIGSDKRPVLNVGTIGGIRSPQVGPLEVSEAITALLLLLEELANGFGIVLNWSDRWLHHGAFPCCNSVPINVSKELVLLNFLSISLGSETLLRVTIEQE